VKENGISEPIYTKKIIVSQVSAPKPAGEAHNVPQTPLVDFGEEER